MSQIFADNKVIPVTLISAGPCTVTQTKTEEKDGYHAVQIGFDALPENKVAKSQKGKGYRWVKEFPGTKEDVESIPSEGIDVSVFEEGDKVQISGISKGKGFQGGVKRWGMHGRNASHGVKHEERTIGSVGDAGVAKVFKGKKMPGHMGVDRVTVRKVKVVQVNKEENMLAVKGAIPGRLGTLLEIKG